MNDLQPFHEMQSNPNVMRFADGEVKSIEAHKKELCDLIDKYNQPNNDFWIYAIDRKEDIFFVGTVALVKDNNDDEIGYRFLEKYWKNGYGSEICKGLINYCKKIGLHKIIGYVADENLASVRILEQHNFEIVAKIKDEYGNDETKYELEL